MPVSVCEANWQTTIPAALINKPTGNYNVHGLRAVMVHGTGSISKVHTTRTGNFVCMACIYISNTALVHYYRPTTLLHHTWTNAHAHTCVYNTINGLVSLFSSNVHTHNVMCAQQHKHHGHIIHNSPYPGSLGQKRGWYPQFAHAFNFPDVPGIPHNIMHTCLCYVTDWSALYMFICSRPTIGMTVC